MSKNALIVMMGAAVLIALVAVFLAMDDKAKKSGGTPSAAAGAVKPATPAVAEKPPTLKEQIEDFSSPVWGPMRGGMETEVTKDEIRIHGTTQYADWAHGNGIVMGATIPDGDFTASVDIKIAKFTGDTSYKNPYIRVESRNRSAIGIFANPAAFYQMHDWKNPTQTHSTTHRLFGDEATTYHRMTLKWVQEPGTTNGTATATVDGEPIGSFQTQLGPARKISLFVNSQTKGCDVEVLFKNLKVEIPTSPDETP